MKTQNTLHTIELKLDLFPEEIDLIIDSCKIRIESSRFAIKLCCHQKKTSSQYKELKELEYIAKSLEKKIKRAIKEG